MKHFLTEHGNQLLEGLSFTKTLYAFDFDGTLARIVTEPDQAQLSEQTEALLKRLSSIAPVAIISGRSRKDLKTRIPKNVSFTIGNHGIEGISDQIQKIQKAKTTTANWKKSFQKILQDPFFEGIELEDKGVSLALHYRKCRKKKEVRARLLQIIKSLKDSPRLIPGKSVLNLVPSGAPHKGMALLELMSATGATRALYIGDDDTDEDVFSLQDERIFSIRVGKKRISHAKYYLKRQLDINTVLRTLLRFYEEKKK